MKNAFKIVAFLATVASNVQAAPVNAAPKPFVIAVLPDTQFYSQDYPEIYTSQTQWLAANSAARGIKFVLHEGDVVNRNGDKNQWKRAQTSMSFLDGKVPYAVLPGNHDMGFLSIPASSRNTDNLNEYFPLSKFSSQPWFGGAFQANKVDNTYSRFTTDGVEYLLFSLEFGPRDAVLEWAGRIIAANPTSRAIVVSHAHTYQDNSLQGSKSSHTSNPESYLIGRGANNGQKVWEKLIKKHPNILMVLNGHMHDGRTVNSGRVTGTGDAGNKVYQMLADYQDDIKGGNGFLRLLTFDPAARTISIETYSPYINEYKTDAGNKFVYTDVELGPLVKQ